jgi:hypothetical protein
MWSCTRCYEEIDDGFDVCWNCGTDRSGKIDESFETADAPIDAPIEESTRLPKARCCASPS